MILLTLLILTTYTMHRAYGQEYIYEKFFFIVVYAGVMISDAILYKYRDFSESIRRPKNNSVFIYINNVDVAVLGVLCFFWYYSNS